MLPEARMVELFKSLSSAVGHAVPEGVKGVIRQVAREAYEAGRADATARPLVREEKAGGAPPQGPLPQGQPAKK